MYFYQLGLRLQLANPPGRRRDDGVPGSGRGIDLVNEVTPIWPGSTAYYDERYGPRGWSNAVVLNLAIGQGENTQTLINMVRFYAALAGNGKTATPYLVQPDQPSDYRSRA